MEESGFVFRGILVFERDDTESGAENNGEGENPAASGGLSDDGVRDDEKNNDGACKGGDGHDESGEGESFESGDFCKEADEFFRKNSVDVEWMMREEIELREKYLLYGISFQVEPFTQSVMIRCTHGEITYYAMDLRRGSETYREYFEINLSEQNQKVLYVPKGFGHGFITNTESSRLVRWTDKPNSLKHKRMLSYFDPNFRVQFRSELRIPAEEIVNLMSFSSCDMDFSIKVMVTGASGILGSDVVEKLKSMKIKTIAVGRSDFDITDKKQTKQFILKHKPDVVIHCAGYTDIDKAEDDEKTCFAVNAIGAYNVARACRMVDAKMVYISTSDVYSGRGVLIPQVDKPTDPINVFGKSKVAGEILVRKVLKKHFIVRTSWLYGGRGDNFVTRMLRLSQTQEEVDAICDQVGAPTYTVDLAALLVTMIRSDKYGTYHATNMRACSWYDFTLAIFKKANIKTKVNPVLAEECPTRARRPHNSRLSKDKLKYKGFEKMPSWHNGIERYLLALKKDDEFKHLFPVVESKRLKGVQIRMEFSDAQLGIKRDADGNIITGGKVIKKKKTE